MKITSCDCFEKRAVKFLLMDAKVAVRAVDISSKFDVSIYSNRKFRKPEILEEFNEIEYCPYCGKEIEVENG